MDSMGVCDLQWSIFENSDFYLLSGNSFSFRVDCPLPLGLKVRSPCCLDSLLSGFFIDVCDLYLFFDSEDLISNSPTQEENR